MTSPVDTTVKFVKCEFSDAVFMPFKVTAVAGTLISAFDAFLVNGWDSVTPTSIVVAGGVATITFSGAHSSVVDMVVLISGITGGPTGFANLNGEQKVTARSGSVATFAAPLVSNGTATGSLTVINSPAGWTKPWSGTNLAMYQSADPLANGGGMVLYVDDTQGQYARVRGFETASGIAAGLGPFPTDGQLSNGGFWHKSTQTAGSTNPLTYILAADTRFLYYYSMPNTTTNGASYSGPLRGFGDLIPLKVSGDPFCTLLNADNQSSGAAAPPGPIDGGASTNTWWARNFTGLGISLIGQTANYGNGGNLSGGVNSLWGAFPDQVTGKLSITKQWCAAGTSLRGIFPGLWCSPMVGLWNSFRLGSILPGADEFLGRRGIAIVNSNTGLSNTPAASSCGISFIDITGPWR